MIKAFSFTCLRDIELVKRIHEQLTSVGIEHIMYVDESEVSRFPFPCVSRGSHPNGTNGFGRSGFYAKLVCIKDMVSRISDGDTILDCDSDVTFDSPEMALDMKCSENEFKGWNGGSYSVFSAYTNIAGDEAFFYTSGPCKSYSRSLAEKLINSDIESAIQKLMRNGFTPSEDCTLGFLLSRFGKVTNMAKYYRWEFLPYNLKISKQDLPELCDDQITSIGWAKHADYYFSQLPDGHDVFETRVLSKYSYIKKYSRKEDLPKIATIFTEGQNSLTECLKTLHTDGSYILILRNRDASVHSEVLGRAPPSLKRFYTVNAIIENDVCIPTPVGTATWFEPITIFRRILSEKTERNTEPSIFFQASLNTPHRKEIFEIVKHNPLFAASECDVSSNDAIDNYFRSMQKHVFTASPCGLGADCLRIWETIIMGGIPILDDVPELRHFEDLPVVYTSDWKNITHQWCINEIENLKRRFTSTDRIRMSYWDAHIHDSKLKHIKASINTEVKETPSPTHLIIKPLPKTSLKFLGGHFKFA